jgi:hypothetical protein
LAVVVAGLSFSGPAAWAVEEGKTAAPAAKASGEIASVDAQLERLTLKVKANPGTQPASFVVDPTAAISKGQQSLKLTDLKAGDWVTVEYTKQRDSDVVSSVVVQTPGVEKAPATSSAQQ